MPQLYKPGMVLEYFGRRFVIITDEHAFKISKRIYEQVIDERTAYMCGDDFSDTEVFFLVREADYLKDPHDENDLYYSTSITSQPANIVPSSELALHADT